ncbi:unnamed protein product (macronuclear) [Paramecium tetraurelia]|uniref:TOG domain-containing protein n=1 Tax=Paramecium tetraurelia TaxID=5888 RepID=A0DR06_PARTE|nr:uncharacterized protein GSPATT00002874001 [Paramecium tetraurelia]CAK85473.1 unnamed protein product [Paramecium tetraurelia]|eukprot:XP_001452870.1 hypothetical protein (macronuclear) [Paramecium tetraurelia strain d4-2]
MPKIENTTGMPINLIIDELKSDDIRKRIHSVKHLDLIASTIGPERTKSELIPFIQGMLKYHLELLDDDDEVLIELVESLSRNFIELVGGQAQVLLPTFEALCRVEDASVREKAANQLKKCFALLPDQKKIEELSMGIIKRLNDSDYYLAKNAVVILVPAILNQVSQNNQNDLINIILKISQDQIPQVRKFSSMYFQVFRYIIAGFINETFIQNTLNSFIKDEQDFIRMYIVDALIASSKTAFFQKQQNFVLNMFKQLAEDQSWRVRYYFCDKLAEIGESVGKDSYRKNFQNYHLKFLQDSEPEMKSIAALKIEKLSSLMDAEEIMNKLIPLLKSIQSDSNSFVRNSLASSVLSLSPIIGKKNTSEQILPIFLTLLKDQDSDVRITLFKKLSLLTSVLGVDSLSQSVIPALTELAQDKNWRIRASTIEVLSFFARAIGPEFLSDKVLKLLLDWLGDKVYSVRQTAIQQTAQLIQILGIAWADRNLLTKIWGFQSIQNYLQRLTVLFTITQIASSLNNDYILKTILPLLQQMSKDSVANVRSNVCKTAILLAKEKGGNVVEPLKKVLQSLCDDQDAEVKYQAKSALESL